MGGRKGKGIEYGIGGEEGMGKKRVGREKVERKWEEKLRK